jgi:hypothetical protein
VQNGKAEFNLERVRTAHELAADVDRAEQRKLLLTSRFAVGAAGLEPATSAL